MYFSTLCSLRWFAVDFSLWVFVHALLSRAYLSVSFLVFPYCMLIQELHHLPCFSCCTGSTEVRVSFKLNCLTVMLRVVPGTAPPYLTKHWRRCPKHVFVYCMRLTKLHHTSLQPSPYKPENQKISNWDGLSRLSEYEQNGKQKRPAISENTAGIFTRLPITATRRQHSQSEPGLLHNYTGSLIFCCEEPHCISKACGINKYTDRCNWLLYLLFYYRYTSRNHVRTRNNTATAIAAMVFQPQTSDTIYCRTKYSCSRW